MKTERMNVSGMTCGGCSSTVMRALQNVSGVCAVKVSLASGEASVQYEEQVTSPAQLQAAVRLAGYAATSSGKLSVNANHKPQEQGRTCCCG